MLILTTQIPYAAKPFLDNIAICGLKTKYSNKEVKPRLRRFIVEYIKNLDKVLANLERVGLTVYREKLQLCYKQIKIVGYVTNEYSRYLDTERVVKLVKQLTSIDQREVRILIEIFVYYKIQLKDFAQLLRLLFSLLKKDVKFIQTKEYQQSKDTITELLISTLALVALDYKPKGGLIIVGVDSSLYS